MKAVIEHVREWLRTYEGLKGRLDVDFLGEDADTYSVDTIPCEKVLKKYKDGSKLEQFQFTISSRRLYEQDIEQNIDNLQFFEDLTAWIEQKQEARELPTMDGDRTALRIIVTSTAYPFVVTEDGKARYQLQLRLEYFKRRSR